MIVLNVLVLEIKFMVYRNVCVIRELRVKSATQVLSNPLNFPTTAINILLGKKSMK